MSINLFKTVLNIINYFFQWNELAVDFSDYGFIAPSTSSEFWGPNLISLKAGDYNLNGFVDLLAVLADRR